MKKTDHFNAVDRLALGLLENSIHFLIGEISEDNINETIKWLVYENLNLKTDKVLTLYINSQGGDLYQAFGLIDMMANSQLPVRTIGFGSVMSAAFLISSSGTRGERYIAANTGIMCHQMSAAEEVGKYHDIKAQRKETDRLNRTMHDIIKKNTTLDSRLIETKLLPAHDVYMTAAEMIDIGAADHIL